MLYELFRQQITSISGGLWNFPLQPPSSNIHTTDRSEHTRRANAGTYVPTTPRREGKRKSKKGTTGGARGCFMCTVHSGTPPMETSPSSFSPGSFLTSRAPARDHARLLRGSEELQTCSMSALSAREAGQLRFQSTVAMQLSHGCQALEAQRTAVSALRRVRRK